MKYNVYAFGLWEYVQGILKCLSVIATTPITPSSDIATLSSQSGTMSALT